jgi:hypothetical protein
MPARKSIVTPVKPTTVKRSAVKKTVRAADTGAPADVCYVLVAGGVAPMRNASAKPVEPNVITVVEDELAPIIERIRRDPALGEQLAREAGIITRSGKLSKSYR